MLNKALFLSVRYYSSLIISWINWRQVKLMPGDPWTEFSCFLIIKSKSVSETYLHSAHVSLHKDHEFCDFTLLGFKEV